MEVKIQYSIDIEDILSTTNKLLPWKEKSNLEEKYKKIVLAISEDNATTAIKLLDESRKDLYKIDRRYADIDAILRGYVGITTAELVQTISQPQETDEEAVNYLKEFIEEHEHTAGEANDSTD